MRRALARVGRAGGCLRSKRACLSSGFGPHLALLEVLAGGGRLLSRRLLRSMMVMHVAAGDHLDIVPVLRVGALRSRPGFSGRGDDYPSEGAHAPALEHLPRWI